MPGREWDLASGVDPLSFEKLMGGKVYGRSPIDFNDETDIRIVEFLLSFSSEK